RVGSIFRLLKCGERDGGADGRRKHGEDDALPPPDDFDVVPETDRRGPGLGSVVHERTTIQGGAAVAGILLRLGVYADLLYRRDADGLSADRAFVKFVTSLPAPVTEIVLFGRLDPQPGRNPYALPSDVRFV